VGAGERPAAFAAGNGTGAPRQALIDPLLGKPPKDKLDGGEADDGGQDFREVLKVLGSMPIASEPGEGAHALPVALPLASDRNSAGTSQVSGER
jgi:hypothetical protein